MRKRDSQIVLTALLTSLWLFLLITNRAVTTGNQDAGVYLGFARQFFDEGLRANIFREPVFPLFLTFFMRVGLDPVIWGPITQSAIFLTVLFLALRTLWPAKTQKLHALQGALIIAMLPSIALTLNGALYTESLSASMVLAQVVLIARWSRAKIANGLGIGLCSILLCLTKGSFIYIQYLLPFIVAIWAWFSKAWPRREIKTLLIALVFAAIAGRASVALWFGLRPGEPVLSSKIYARGGALLYGRVEYARTFNFVKDTPGYLLNALSESACRRTLGANTCDRYTWDAEGMLGWQRHGEPAQGKLSDEQLFAEAKTRALQSPIRQLVFIFYENSRFVLHHSMNGFARTAIEPVSQLFGSLGFAIILKFFNIALYLFPIIWFVRKKSRKLAIRTLRESNVISLGICYSIALLLVHGFVPTLVRMCFPVTPVLLILNWYILNSKKSAV